MSYARYAREMLDAQSFPTWALVFLERWLTLMLGGLLTAVYEQPEVGCSGGTGETGRGPAGEYAVA